MNKTKLQKILLLGSGALRIGQAGEFDYSGSQALKALREENIESILINPNIATVQTDKGLADQVYFLPVETYFVEKVIQKEKVGGILLGFGGQTALNCGLDLEKSGVLRKYGVEVLGTPLSSIRNTEDRHLFAKELKKIGVYTAKSKAVYSPEEAVKSAEEIGFPVMMRSGFALGGKGSAIINNKEDCAKLARISLSSVPQLLIEECLVGWKEIEYEVMRDSKDNCIVVCGMENFDPVGIHTGESIVVAPTQTLDDFEYQLLRDVAIKTIRHLNILGECNIQFALNPRSRQYRVIEVNARLSRSSALASKATGYPLAYVATKVALGRSLPEIPNAITKKTTCFFEPALDYIVCKFPRWDLDKFNGADKQIGTEMKSVGEVMAVGRSFAEVIQKATRMLEIGVEGLESDKYSFDNLKNAISIPTPHRIFAITNALKQGISVEEISALSGIDLFFLQEIERIVRLELQIKKSRSLKKVDTILMQEAKCAGFSDKAIANLINEQESNVRKRRRELGIKPYLSQIDTLAAEYPAQTNFLYFTYASTKSDVEINKNSKIIILGSGCYRIGSSVEFDWCAVNAATAARELGYETIMLNNNPETVSTDYDICEKLVFDEISLEIILELYELEKPEGIIISMGGQIPNNLSNKLNREDIKIFGTSPESIDKAENRHKFSSLLDQIGIYQPTWAEVNSLQDIQRIIDNLGGFPVLVRPSYVLSGTAMRVAYTIGDLKVFLTNAMNISGKQHPVIISKFEDNAKEIEYDAIASQGKVVLYSIAEHIEKAGVHSGDSTLMIPHQTLNPTEVQKIKSIGDQLAKHLKITGPFNVQMLIKQNIIKVIECNLRSSRSLPFVSKAMGVNFAHIATYLMLGARSKFNINYTIPTYATVKSAQFSFERIKGVDPRLGVEMSSTGEVACFGKDKDEALLASTIASGFRLPKKGVLLSLGAIENHINFKNEAILLSEKLVIYATSETSTSLKKFGINHTTFNATSLFDNQQEHLLDFLKSGNVDLIISIPDPQDTIIKKEGYYLRRLAVDLGISLIMDIQLARSITHAMSKYDIEDISILSWNDYQQNSINEKYQLKKLIYLHDLIEEGKVFLQNTVYISS